MPNTQLFTQILPLFQPFACPMGPKRGAQQEPANHNRSSQHAASKVLYVARHCLEDHDSYNMLVKKWMAVAVVVHFLLVRVKLECAKDVFHILVFSSHVFLMLWAVGLELEKKMSQEPTPPQNFEHQLF